MTPDDYDAFDAHVCRKLRLPVHLTWDVYTMIPEARSRYRSLLLSSRTACSRR
jgi:hypothetical protein